MKPQIVIPWCDSRRQYCAAGCTVRPDTHSGNCDWSRCIDQAGAEIDDDQPQPVQAQGQAPGPRPSAHRFSGKARRFTGFRRQGQARF